MKSLHYLQSEIHFIGYLRKLKEKIGLVLTSPYIGGNIVIAESLINRKSSTYNRIFFTHSQSLFSCPIYCSQKHIQTMIKYKKWAGISYITNIRVTGKPVMSYKYYH